MIKNKEPLLTDDVPYIPISLCKRRHVYRLLSRNLKFGVFAPELENGFIGIRTKFKDTFLFTEYHWDNGPPYGTVKPLEDLGPLKDDTIQLWATKWREDAPSVKETAVSKFIHLGAFSDSRSFYMNHALFKALEKFYG